ncbi:MAG TPA: hypothetical protein PKC84_08900 [Paracoccaceae bacterium]|nr:hypothetical protein [Paracoccaceae bacterium]
MRAATALVLLLLGILAPRPATALVARGVVFEDLNRNGVRDPGEPGLRGVRVSNQREIVLTDRAGRWELPATDDTVFFVIKPRGFMPPLSADRLQAGGNVFLRGVTATGEVRLLGAKLGGNLDFIGATFTAQGGAALNADRLQAEGSVFLRGVKATGAVRLLGARLGGNLECDGATFTAQGGKALDLRSARITNAFFWRRNASAKGVLDLTAAEIGTICDDPACWPAAGDLILERCRYGAFVAAPVDADSRIRWLALQDPARFGQDFWPQPYEECARVLREAGHGGEARAVLIEKERLQRAARRARIRARDLNFGAPRAAALWFVDEVLLGATIRYGRAPMLAFAWLAGLWLLGWVVFAWAEAAGGLKPNLPQLQRAPEWVLCGHPAGEAVAGPSLPDAARGLRQPGETQYTCFLRQPEAASYPRFNPLIYSADTLVPVVSLEMQAYWLPDDTTAPGYWARWFLWAQIALGWGLTLLAVAGFSGLVKQDSK